MRRPQWNRGLKAAALLASLAFLLTGCSFHDAERNLRFGWPTGVTHEAERMRVLWTWSGVAALALGAVVWGLIFWCCIRYRKRNDDVPRQTKYNLAVELVCVVVPLLVIVGLFWRTVVVEDDVNTLSKDPDVLVQVTAFKWNWQFTYEQVKDGSGKETSTTYPGHNDLINGKTDAPLFLSTIGSDTEIPILVLPIGKTVQVIEHSQDVIHSFWVPEFLFKRDVIPYGNQAQQDKSGLHDNRFEFTATTTGSYVGRCAELCGTYHSQMNFEVRVVQPEQFTKYLAALKKIGPDDPARQAKALQMAGFKHLYATTTHPFDTNRTRDAAIGGS